MKCVGMFEGMRESVNKETGESKTYAAVAYMGGRQSFQVTPESKPLFAGFKHGDTIEIQAVLQTFTKGGQSSMFASRIVAVNAPKVTK